MWPIVEFWMDSPVSGPFYSPQDAPDLASMYANGWPSSLPLGLSGAANGSTKCGPAQHLWIQYTPPEV